jgi:crotonobetainyl-CoA:carnitine CoA-transferase CaiB-like acyl-CoA transferase
VRTGSAHPSIAPYDTAATRNGPIFLGVGNDRQFRSLVEVLGRPALADDSRFASNADRVINRAELGAIIGALLAECDREDLGARLLDRGVPSSPVHDAGETLTDPQVLRRSMVVELDGYRGVGIPVNTREIYTSSATAKTTSPASTTGRPTSPLPRTGPTTD